MGITALVMAGGKGRRMALSEEKPLLKVGGKPLIEHVILALKKAKKIDSIVVAISQFTPKTAQLMRQFPVYVVKTPGKDFIADMGYAVKTLKLRNILAIGADLPLISCEVIDTIVQTFERCGKPALTVVVPIETKEKLGLSREYAFTWENRLVVPAGINIIDGQKIQEEELDQEIFLMDQKEVALNINTVQELKIAESFFKKS